MISKRHLANTGKGVNTIGGTTIVCNVKRVFIKEGVKFQKKTYLYQFNTITL